VSKSMHQLEHIMNSNAKQLKSQRRVSGYVGFFFKYDSITEAISDVL